MAKELDLWRVRDSWNGWNYIRAKDAAEAAATVETKRLAEAKRDAKAGSVGFADIDLPRVEAVEFVVDADHCL
jgi:hypothetical protein